MLLVANSHIIQSFPVLM